MEIRDIYSALNNAGISSGDTVMIHGDAMIAAQLVSIPKELRLSYFFEAIISYLGPNGTLVIPTFSYSFTRSEIFDVQNSTSRVGAFSESFRVKYPHLRTRHPIFSVVAVGKKSELFLNTTIEDCFGESSIFQVLHDTNAILMNLGCDFMLTYTHFIEQKLGVSYRYFKEFSGLIRESDLSMKEIVCRYFVGDLGVKYSLNLDKIKTELTLMDMIRIVPFGRFASYSVKARDFDLMATRMLIADEYSLIQEGCDA